ncbi:hypothetical protein TNCV_4590761 [Trichonephila clavipes]|nr:hypothetical protein TNCV_4590761 [Trichonephila clavipes]
MHTCAEAYNRTLSHTEKAEMHYMYDKNGNGKVALRMYQRSFLIDECRITEFFSSYIVNFVKQVRWTNPLANPITQFIELRLLFIETSEESCLCDFT